VTGLRRPGDLAEDLIVDVIKKSGPSTRSELTRLTGLTKTTIADHTRSLLERGILHETEPTGHGRGRPARVLELAGSRGSVAVAVLSHGVTLVGGPVHCLVASADGRVRRFATVPPGPNPVAAAVRAIGRMVDANPELGTLTGCVLGVPLPLQGTRASGSDRRAAAVIPSMAHLVGAQPQAAVAAALEVPTWAANDTDLAALGEACYGAGRDSADVAFVRVIAGLGMGVARGRSIPAKVREPAGEIAHIRGRSSTERCICGSVGCWYSTVKDGLALGSKVNVRGKTCASMEDLQEAVAENDRDVVRRVRQLGLRIGQALGSFYALSRPSQIILEAELGPVFGPLSAGMADALRPLLPDWNDRPLILTPGQLAARADLLGGFRLHQLLAPRAVGPATSA